MDAYDAGEVEVVRRNPAVTALGLAPLVAGLILLAVSPLFGGELLDLWRAGMSLTLVGVVTGLIAWFFRPFDVHRKVRLKIDARGVHLDGALRIARSRIRSGFVQPRQAGAPPSVFLIDATTEPALEISASDPHQAHAILAALNLDASSAAAGFATASPMLAAIPSALGTVVMLVSFLYALPMWSALLLATPSAMPVALFTLAILAACFAPGRVVVGTDGVSTRWFFLRRFIPHREIVGLMPKQDGLLIRTRDGKTRAIFTSPRSSAWGSVPKREALVYRIQGAMALAAKRASDEQTAALLARGERPRDVWLAEARARAAGRGDGYRHAALPEDRLWRICEDPLADASARVGAAVALRASLDETGRERLVRVAEATASPEVRVALSAAATSDGTDDAALLDALDALPARAARR